MKTPAQFILVDDDHLCNFISKRIIKQQFPDAEIVEFQDPLKALEYIIALEQSDAKERTLILLDINMPKMNGWELLESVAIQTSGQQERKVIVMLTSSIDQRDRDKATLYPDVRGYLTKPLSPPDLLQAVEECMPAC